MPHVRDSSKYRTPYAPWGGFTNGYEGNLRAHLMRTPDALFGVQRHSLGLNGITPGLSAVPRGSFSGLSTSANNSFDMSSQAHPSNAQYTPSISPTSVHTPSLGPPFGAQSAPPSGAPSSMSCETLAWRSKSTGDFNDRNNRVDGETVLHPAIRASYAAMLQNRNVKVEPQANSGNGIGNAAHSAAPAPPLTTASSFGRPSSEQIPQPKSSTPIPPPCIPTPSKMPQSAVGSASSVKPVATPAKKTPIPAPRPWEALRKAQASVQTASTSAAPVTTNPPGLRAHAQAEVSKHLPVSGMQFNQVVSGPPWQGFPSAVPNSNRFSLPAPAPTRALGCLPYSSPNQSSYPIRRLIQRGEYHQQTL
jgi:hypothetical protein